MAGGRKAEASGGARRAGELEREVLAVLAAAQGPLTPGEVLDRMGRDLAYTTVMTTLSRLHGKGLASRERAGRAYAYTAVTDLSTHTARRMRRLLDAGSDRAGVLARFVAELSPEEERLLATLVAPAPDAPDGDDPTDGQRAGGR